MLCAGTVVVANKSVEGVRTKLSFQGKTTSTGYHGTVWYILYLTQLKFCSCHMKSDWYCQTQCSGSQPFELGYVARPYFLVNGLGTRLQLTQMRKYLYAILRAIPLLHEKPQLRTPESVQDITVNLRLCAPFFIMGMHSCGELWPITTGVLGHNGLNQEQGLIIVNYKFCGYLYKSVRLRNSSPRCVSTCTQFCEQYHCHARIRSYAHQNPCNILL